MNNQGRMGTSFDASGVQLGMVLLQEFLNEIQFTSQPYRNPPVPHPSESDAWIKLDHQNSNDPETYEHAAWLTNNDVAELLGEDLHHAALREHELKTLPPAKQYDAVLSKADRYIALIDDVGRFKGMLNRCALLAQAVKQMVDGAKDSSRY